MRNKCTLWLAFFFFKRTRRPFLSIHYSFQQRFTATGVTDDRPRTGRPRVTTQRQDGHIFRHHVRDLFQTANETGRNTLGNHQRPISGHTRLAGTPWGITRDLSVATRDWQEHPGESPETYQRPHETGRNTLGNHQRPISGHTRLAGTPWGITRDLSAATRDWQEHPGESPETYQWPHETGRNTLGNHQRPISGQTVRRLLAERDLENRRPARVPVLTRRHRLARLQWARNHANWNWRQWRTFLFTDESRYCLSHVDGRVRVWRRRGERYSDDCVMQNNAWGGPSVMLWGGIGLNQLLGPVIFRGLGPGRGNGVTAQRHKNQILRPHVVPFFQAHGNFVFQQDNARAHAARLTQDFLQCHNVHTMAWPALSSDLNPIEHFWDHLQRELNQIRPRPATAAQLQQVILQAWDNIPRPAVNRLTHTMRRSCQAGINANGGHTPY